MTQGEWIAVLLLSGILLLAVRCLWKGRKKGGCNGNCAGCKGCHKE